MRKQHNKTLAMQVPPTQDIHPLIALLRCGPSDRPFAATAKSDDVRIHSVRRGSVETELIVLPKTILRSPSFRRSTINVTDRCIAALTACVVVALP